ncbi:MAG: exosortase/archaeosortase family protein [Desulfurococcaceae archaeon]
MTSIEEYRDYAFKLTSGFTVLTGLLGYLAETSYREFFESITRLAQSEEYSYIIVSFFTILAVLYLSTRYIGFSYGFRLSKVVFASVLLVLAVAIFSLARVDLEYRVQLMGLSFTCIFIALLMLVYEPTTLSEAVVLLTPLLLIPLPARLVDSLTPVLSRYIGKLVGVVTGVRVIESPGFTQLEVTTPSGETVRLSVEAACTGIVTASSILAITPLLVYIASFSVDKLARKVTISLLSILTALSIGLLGNFVRVLLVVYAATRLGAEQAYTLFHYSPSLIYSLLSVLAAFYLVRRYLKFKAYWSRTVHGELALGATWEYVAGVLLLVAIATGIISAGLHIVSTSTGSLNAVISASDVADYLQNPAKYLSTSKLRFTGAVYDSFLTRVLGALATYRVQAVSLGEYYTGYIEVVDTPARLHTWELCLTLQGYFVKASWSSSIEGVKVHFILIERGKWRGVLAHVIIPVTIRTPSREYTVYTRVSLLGAGSESLADKLSEALLSIIREHSVQVDSSVDGSALLAVLSQSLTFILGALFTYSIVVLAYRLRRGLRG